MVIHMLPLIILAIGIIALTSHVVLETQTKPEVIWKWHTIILIFGLLGQLLIANQSATAFLRGGLINDGITNMFGLTVLTVCLFLQFNRISEKAEILPSTSLLTLCFCFFSLTAVQSNRISFSVLTVVGMLLSSKGALLTESHEELKADNAYHAARKAFGFAIFAILFVGLCILVFGESQFDEIQIHLARSKESMGLIQLIQLMTLFGAFYVGNLPPVYGIFGSSRKSSSWTLATLFSALFAIVSLQIFVKQGLFMFTHVSVGATDLEPQIGTQILFYMKIASAIGLVLLPFLALIQKNIKQSLLYFLINPFLQIFMAVSFGQKELMSYAFGAIPTAVIAVSVICLSSKFLDLGDDTVMKNWVGIGRTNPVQGTMFIVAIWALAGFSPFYTGRLVLKTLCVNSEMTIFLVANVILAGYYALRLTAFAFQKPLEQKATTPQPLKFEKIFSYTQSVALILMGIFWQPLYKYGSYTIRHLFGDF